MMNTELNAILFHMQTVVVNVELQIWSQDGIPLRLHGSVPHSPTLTRAQGGNGPQIVEPYVEG